MDKPKDEKINKDISRFWGSFRVSYGSLKQNWMRCHYQSGHPECLSNINIGRRISNKDHILKINNNVPLMNMS